MREVIGQTRHYRERAKGGRVYVGRRRCAGREEERLQAYASPLVFKENSGGVSLASQTLSS